VLFIIKPLFVFSNSRVDDDNGLFHECSQARYDSISGSRNEREIDSEKKYFLI
jgi:hypothetical protein